MKWLVALVVVAAVSAAPREKRQAGYGFGGGGGGQQGDLPQCTPGQARMADPANCRFYFECDLETGTNMGRKACQQNLFFDERSGNCEWINNNAPPQCGQQQLQQLGRSIGEASLKLQLCQQALAVDNGQALHIADPNNCRNFIICANGADTGTSLACAAGTLFNITRFDGSNVGECAIMGEEGCGQRPLNPADREFQGNYMRERLEALTPPGQQGGFGPGGFNQGGFPPQQGGGFNQGGFNQGGFPQQQGGGGFNQGGFPPQQGGAPPSGGFPPQPGFDFGGQPGGFYRRYRY